MIKPLKKQQHHINQLLQIIDKHKYAFDFSEPGSGKTYCASYILTHHHFKHAAVVCPTSVIPKWKDMRRKYNLPILTITSYQSFCGKVGYDLKHKYLTRKDMSHYEGTKQIINTSYTPTAYYRKLINEGFLLILDEIQNVKNKTLTHKACFAAISPLLNSKTSATLMLSGVAFDSCRNIPLILQLVGESPRDYNTFMLEYMPEHMSRMISNKDYHIKCRNYYMRVNNTEEFNKELVTLQTLNTDYKLIQQVRKIEILKTGLFIRRAQEILANPNTKLVIILNFTKPINMVYDALSAYKPACLTGSSSATYRGKVIEQFQKPNASLRLIVGNMHVLSAGIDLDDKHGNWTRYCIINQNFSALDQQQLYYRFKREDTKSSPHIEFLFANVAQREYRITKSIEVKNSIIQDLMDKEMFYFENVYE